MGGRTRIAIGVILVLTMFVIIGVAACTREKPAPTSSPVWAPPTTRLTTPGPTAGATVIRVEETPTVVATTPVPTAAATTPLPPSPTPTRVSQPLPTPTPVPPTPAPPVLPTPVLPTPAPVGPTFTYIVKPGDTLYSIARRYGTSVDVLVSLNSLSNADDIKVGQELQIPGTAPTPVPTPVPAPQVHIVQKGDTLYSIARYYGVTPAELAAVNGITDPDRIYVGQRLVIPAGGVEPTPIPRTHVVQAGETLLEIALRYGVTMQALQTANNISDPDHIEVGQVLVIP